MTSHQLTASLDTTSEPDLLDAGGGAAQHGPRSAPSRSGWLHRRWVQQVCFAAAGIALFVAYTAQARTVADTSDSGAKALQAWDMLHGNVLLRGWTLSDVSFYTTELPQYMLVELVRGLTGDTVHVAGALTYTLMVLLAGLLAKGRATGREGLIRLLVAVGILLAPSLHAGTHLLLAGPDHTGTQVPLLVIWIVLDRARARWWVPTVVAVLLVWAQVADTLVLYEGVLPLVVVCAVRMYQRRGPLAAQWYELSLATGAVGSAVGAELILVAIRQAGGFAVGTPIAGFATASDMFTELPQKAQSSLDVFGASFFGMPFGSAAIVVLIHLAGVALVAWAVAVTLHRFCREADLIAQVLTVAFVVLLAAYLVGTKPDSQEIIGLLPIGAVLAGRVLASRLIRSGLVPAMALVLVCYGGILVSHTVQPAAPSENQLAASWLQAHHLNYGLAGYWQANGITVDGGDRVQIRPVRVLNHELVITPAESDASWYDARRHDAHFVVWAPPGSCLNVCLSMASLRQILGPPTATYQVGAFRVLVWRQNLLTSLHTLWWCGNVWPWATSHQPSATPCE